MNLQMRKPSISELSEEQALELVLKTRKSRLTRKTKKKKKKQVKNPDMYLQAYAASLDDNKLKELIEKLEKKSAN